MEQSGTTRPAATGGLDFSVNYNPSGKENANARAVSILPEHPQGQLQSKLMALVQSKQLHEPAMDGSPPLMVEQTEPASRKTVAKRESLAHHVKPIPKPRPKPALPLLLKTESPKSRERCNVEQKDGTPKKQKKCSCKNSRCLKL